MKKGKFNKWIILVALLLVLVIVWVLVLKSGFSKKQDNGDIIVKDNVHTITRETDSDKQPDRVKRMNWYLVRILDIKKEISL